MFRGKKLKTSPKVAGKPDKPDFLDGLPDDLAVYILCKLSSSASCPSDFINVLLTCKRLNHLALHPFVLSKAGTNTLAIRAKNWSDSAHRFLKLCINAGNTDAAYALGMIRFYCLQNQGSGTSLMAKAAIKSHVSALYSLSVIQFNGSGASRNEKDLRAGVALCARAALLGHIDAVRELGHCLQDGYGVRQNILKGRRLLVEANAREFMQSLPLPLARTNHPKRLHCGSTTWGCPLLSDFGYNVGAPEMHPVNRFLKEWFESGKGELAPGLRLCSHSGCGRPETRPHEFRRCSACGTVNYCSRGCQALDWKLRHKMECVPMDRWIIEDDGHGVAGMVEMVGPGNVGPV
ncbi:F-box protein At5g50450 [Mangifera indica]|uniref:F-box protein At5g50450 n=1 Tax=Mangifera indica TaxID=29780 RepID=UPI001CF9E6E5|nr:F-box protein At5g50450 [Mangifera indica]